MPQDTANQFWNAHYANEAKPTLWTQVTGIEQEVNRRMTGTDKHWLHWCFEDYLDHAIRPKKVLSIGCGDGAHEIIMARQGYAQSIVAFDGSDTAISVAKSATATDTNRPDFRVATFEHFIKSTEFDDLYDLIICTGSLHHVEPLEDMMSKIRSLLAPKTGQFIVNEYIGPIYNIYSAKRIALINSILQNILNTYKVDDSPYGNPTIEMVKKHDPSEAVRSSLIMELLNIYFEIDYLRYYGGSLLQPLMTKLNSLALPPHNPDPNAKQFVDLLIVLENTLLKSGELPPDFALAICRSNA